MATRRVIIELQPKPELVAGALSASADVGAQLDMSVVPTLPGVHLDPTFPPTVVPTVQPRSPMAAPYISGESVDLALDENGFVDPLQSTIIVRAEVDEDRVDKLLASKAVVGVFADVEIQPALICPGSPPMGTDADVERLLCVPQMHRIHMDGAGVLLAIVDSGINQAYLAGKGKSITIDAARSWVPSAGMVPGAAPVSHGTMCAFDAAIAAPQATFLDIQVLRTTATGPTPMSGVLSDAVRAYSHLVSVMSAPRRPGENRSMVVSNSWGMFHPSWDFPVGHPGNYSDNPNHPFNRIVAALARLGADILFAAGNCGADCPDDRCKGVTTNAIYGANGHPAVLTVAGVDISNTRVGYSTQGPGRLSLNKPDICGYTHFRGSGVYAADGGTSAATPVVAGVLAAVRSKRPYVPGSPAATPAAIRTLLRTTATDLGASGFDFNHGYGVVGGCALYRRFRPVIIIDICKRFPELCRPRPIPVDICKRFPELCRGLPSGPQPPMLGTLETRATLEDIDLEELIGAVWDAAYYDGQQAAGMGLRYSSYSAIGRPAGAYDTDSSHDSTSGTSSGGCGCGCGGS